MSLIDGSMGLVQKAKSKDEFATMICDIIASSFQDCVRENGEFNIALSGGRTPLIVFEKLLDSDISVDWSLVNFFWLDERAVPIKDKQSNFGNAQRFFLDKIRYNNIYPMYDGLDIVNSVSEYRKTLDLQLKKSKSGFPVFDFILLGLGLDGHIASLFPNSLAVSEAVNPCVSVLDSPDNRPRITLTFPVINNSKKNVFMVLGQDKINLLKNININNMTIPINNIDFINTNTSWIIGET